MALDREELKHALKEMITVECNVDIRADEVSDDIALIGEGLGLDSLDALEICVAVKKNYGVRIEAGPDVRKALRSVNALADTILVKMGKTG
jgi:acyl carrier protein